MIQIKYPLQTQDGSPVTVISTEGRGEYPLVGYIKDSTNLQLWSTEGCHSLDYDWLQLEQVPIPVKAQLTLHSTGEISIAEINTPPINLGGERDIVSIRTVEIVFIPGQFEMIRDEAESDTVVFRRPNPFQAPGQCDGAISDNLHCERGALDELLYALEHGSSLKGKSSEEIREIYEQVNASDVSQEKTEIKKMALDVLSDALDAAEAAEQKSAIDRLQMARDAVV